MTHIGHVRLHTTTEAFGTKENQRPIQSNEVQEIPLLTILPSVNKSEAVNVKLGEALESSHAQDSGGEKMTLPRKRVVPRDAQDADQTMPSILFPPLLSLDASNKGGAVEDVFSHITREYNISSDQGAPDAPDDVHDCHPLSESCREGSVSPILEAVSCLRHSQSMPSFQGITLKMPETSVDDCGYGAVAPISCAANRTNTTGTPALAAADGGLDHSVPFPTYIPKLRIRRTSSDIDLQLMPSPWHGGGKEMAYLQKQLKAEALQRRKQQLHNEERNKRRSTKTDDENDAEEDEDTFACAPNGFQFGENRPNDTIMDIAGSPPAILKRRALRRTVSEALEDSGIPEDANLLFTPMGEPLINDEDVAKERAQEDNVFGNEKASHSDTEEVFTMDEDDSLFVRRFSNNVHLLHEESTDDDVEDDVELSPSLMPAGIHYQVGDSSIHDMKSNLPPNASKKVALRPKMKQRTDSFDIFPSFGTHMYKSTDPNVPADDSILTEKVEKVDLSSSACKYRYTSPQKSRFRRPSAQRFMMSASESFDALTYEDRTAIDNDIMDNRNRLNTADSDPFDRFGTSPSFSESNYATPDNSFSNRVSARASKLFSMNQGLDLPLKTSPFAEQNFHTPSSSQARRPRIGLPNPNQLPVAPFLGATIEEESAGPMPSEVSPAPNFATPHNVLERKAIRCNNVFSIPQIADLVVPQLGSPTKLQEVGDTTSSEEKKDFDAEDPKGDIKSPQ